METAVKPVQSGRDRRGGAGGAGALEEAGLSRIEASSMATLFWRLWCR
ncbi:MAG: hypothetical protein HY685_05520 [Chloroflexi bacterium]|nr:hypothetical protein [Chloroflexota bacterium]